MPLTIGDTSFYTLDEISKSSGLTIYTLRGWIRKGKLKAKKTGGKFWVSEDAYKGLFLADDKPKKKKA